MTPERPFEWTGKRTRKYRPVSTRRRPVPEWCAKSAVDALAVPPGADTDHVARVAADDARDAGGGSADPRAVRPRRGRRCHREDQPEAEPRDAHGAPNPVWHR